MIFWYEIITIPTRSFRRGVWKVEWLRFLFWRCLITDPQWYNNYNRCSNWKSRAPLQVLALQIRLWKTWCKVGKEVALISSSILFFKSSIMAGHHYKAGFTLNANRTQMRMRHAKMMRMFDADVLWRRGKRYLAGWWMFGKQLKTFCRLLVLQKEFAYNTFRCGRIWFIFLHSVMLQICLPNE